MAKEIERKFLVFQGISFLKKLAGDSIEQGYLHDKGMTSRVRIVNNTAGVLTLKGPRRGITRDEFEYAIPLEDARELMNYCGSHKLSKTRYEVPVAGHIWHVDIYYGALQGLVTAEIELSAESESFVKPTWVGTEVTEDKSYSNKNLARAARVPLKQVA